MRDEHQYDDILHLPHPVSASHPQMPLADRAAQFSPFAALSGHGEAVRETARLTEDRIWLEEDERELLDRKLRQIRESLRQREEGIPMPRLAFTCFFPDERKSGGSYRTVLGQVKKIDEHGRRLLLEDGTELWMDRLIAIEES